MNLIFCIDPKGGMLFHSRRIGADRIVYERIRELCDGKLFVAPYSASLFPMMLDLHVSEDFLEQAGLTDWCFVETVDPEKYIDKADKIVLFNWNRVYPSDLKFPITELQNSWSLICKEEFSGNSHDRITMEVYRQCKRNG